MSNSAIEELDWLKLKPEDTRDVDEETDAGQEKYFIRT